MQYLAIVPARGGSEGIPRKNITPFLGEPLIVRTLREARGCARLQRIVVSTDCEEIAAVSRAHGGEVPFMRPKELAGGLVPMIEVMRHVLLELEKREEYRPDVVVLLQPTSPLRTARHIGEALDLLEKTEAESVVSLYPAKVPPWWMRTIDADGRVQVFVEGKLNAAQRQEFPTIYALNGAIYASRRSVILEKGKVLGDDTRPYFMSQDESIDVDSPLDLELARFLVLHRDGSPTQS